MAGAFRLSGRGILVGDRGRVSEDPLAIASRPLRFSLPALSLFLANPALELEFFPGCPWVGVYRVRPRAVWPAGRADPAELPVRFEWAVERCVADADVVVVALSGGLDSLAVLYQADRICRQDGRRLIVGVIEMRDDQGVWTSAVAQRLIARLGLQCEVRVIDDRAAPRWPRWTPVGPCGDAMPRHTTALAEYAEEQGAGVILTGQGADELLQAPQFLTSALLHRKRWPQLGRYLADSAQYDGVHALTGEVMSLLGPLLPARSSFALYTAFGFPDLPTVVPAGVLNPRYVGHARDFHRAWCVDRLAIFSHHRRQWPKAAMWDSLFTADVLHGAGSVPVRSPFLDPEFAFGAMAVPLESRYGTDNDIPYHRWKKLVVNLFPEQVRSALPRRKQLYRRALSEHFAAVLGDRPLLCRQLGLLGDVDVNALRTDGRVASSLVALEDWLHGALEIGAEPSDESTWPPGWCLPAF